MPVLREWQPPETFNLLDYRDFQHFPLYDTPPYVLKFNFFNITDPIVINSIITDIRGWNIPECGTEQMLSKITISKNGFDDVYYNNTPSSSVLDLNKDLLLASPKDVIYIVLFPLCPVHMMDINQIIFLTPATTTAVKETDNLNTSSTKPPSPPLPPLPSKENDPYWYLHLTLLIMVLLLLLSLLFSFFRPCKK